VVLETNVVDIEDSDDDDILFLEQKLLEDVSKRKVYSLVNSAVNKQIRESVDLCSDDSDREEQKQDSSGEDESVIEETPPVPSEDQEAAEDSDQDIQVVGSVQNPPKLNTSSKKSKMFKKKLLEMEAREEKRTRREMKRREKAEKRAARESLDSRESVSPEPGKEEPAAVVAAVDIPLPTLAMERLSLEEPNSNKSVLLNRILSTILERQLATDECIQVSNATPRTPRYDKHKESSTSKRKLAVVGEQVKEEFYNRYIEKKEREDRQQYYGGEGGEEENAIDFTIKDEANNHVALLEILEYLKCYTNLNTRPTSSILNVIMKDFIINQNSCKVAARSYDYINQFVLLHLGRDTLNRQEWLNLMLSALRDNQTFNQFEEFSLESGQDLQSCWRFFSLVLQNAMEAFKQSAADTPSFTNNSAIVMLSLLVKICQKDFELWWKHYRPTEHKDNRDLSFPILFYLLEGRRDIIENASNSVLKLYKTFLEKDVDMGETRKLVSMTAMLLAHLDAQDNNGLLTKAKGFKLKFASKIHQIVAKSNLNSDDLYMELSLLKPSWLSLLVSKKYLAQEKEKKVAGLKDVVGGLEELATSCDVDMFACLDNLIPKIIATTQLHNIIRCYWYLVREEGCADPSKDKDNKSQQTGVLAFPGLTRLEKVAHRAPVSLKLKSDVSVLKAQIIEDSNILIAFHNQERILDESAGVLKSAFFKMSSATEF